jgi:alkaline phosphatase
MKKLLFFILFPVTATFAQPTVYTTANAHSHNDYQQVQPFNSAYSLQYGSIEVDVYLNGSDLLVAHTARDIQDHRTLEDTYIKPLQGFIQANKGYVYADTSRSLLLFLDVKTDALPTINKLIDVLMKYPDVTRCASLKIVVSGNKPDPTTYISYPSFLWFDGLLSNRYTKETYSHIVMLSDNFINYTKWNGYGTPPAKDWEALQKAVAKGHALGKKVRFWNAPDFIEGWQKMIELGVDYINTDSIKALAQFLKQNGARKL